MSVKNYGFTPDTFEESTGYNLYSSDADVANAYDTSAAPVSSQSVLTGSTTPNGIGVPPQGSDIFDYKGLTNKLLDFGKDFFTKGDWGIEGKGGVGLGLAQAGLGYLSYKESKKNNKLNRELQRQQIQNNKDIMARNQKENAAVTSFFSSAPKVPTAKPARVG